MYSVIDATELPVTGFPIRISPAQCLFSGSPKLFAANHVLHRHPTPRHPPSALSSLAINIWPLCLPLQNYWRFEIERPCIQFSKNGGQLRPLSQKLKAEDWNSRLPVFSFNLLRSLSLFSINRKLVEVNGIEPMTSCVQSRCSPN